MQYPGTNGRGPLLAVPTPTHFEGEPPFALHYTLAATEEKAMRALAEARLDYNALAAQCIFIGKEVAAPGNFQRTVEVLRPLSGRAPAKGQRVTVEMRGYAILKGAKPALRPDPEIFFIREIRGKIYHAAAPPARGSRGRCAHRP